MATFVAAFDSDCENCDTLVEKGQVARMVGDGLVVHDECPPATLPQPVCSSCWLVHGKAQEGCE